MKREILFCGKRVDNGEWVYGFYVFRPDGTHLIYWKPFDEASQNTYHEVNPDTVCQFTGLLDKNGNKIFEGDKLKNKFGNYVVKFADGSFWACNIDKEDNVPLYVHNEESEMTGNIFDK